MARFYRYDLGNFLPWDCIKLGLHKLASALDEKRALDQKENKLEWFEQK